MMKKYEQLGGFSEGMAAVQRNGKWGYINKDGEELIDCRFENYRPFYGGVAQVALKAGIWNKDRTKIIQSKWGLIDKFGNFLIPPVYNMVSYCSEGCVVCEDGRGEWIFLDLNGYPLFSRSFTYARPFEKGIAVVGKGRRYGVIGRDGEIIIPFEFEWIDGIGCGSGGKITGAKRNGKYGVIDPAGNTIIGFIYDGIRCCPNGLIEVDYQKNRHQYKRGVITATGNTVLDCVYDDIDCGEVVIAVNIGQKEGRKYFHTGRWGWTDLQGNIIVEPRYANVAGLRFSEGLTEVRRRNKVGFANFVGEVIITFRYECTTGFSNGLALVKSKGKSGYIDRNGNVVIPLVYDFLSIFQEEYATAELNGGQFYIDKSGTRVLF